MWKQFISVYFHFTKRERTGVIVLLCLTGFFLVLPFFYPYFIPQKTYDHSAFEQAIAALRLKEADGPSGFSKYGAGKRLKTVAGRYSEGAEPGELFFFDPNSASAADWKKLGVPPKTIGTIQNYLSKGGKFYKKEDIGKIWGLHPREVQRLEPYVRIKNEAEVSGTAEKKYDRKEYKREARVIAAVDINTGDTAAFIALPGIGSKLSQRIINFRDKLGGFYSVEQVKETFGLPDSSFQKIRGFLQVGDPGIKKININTATAEELKAHPYLRYALANAIVQYRSQHGRYRTVADLKNIMIITEEAYNKVAPYLVAD